MLIDWVVGRGCRGDVEKQVEALGRARANARTNIERLREVSLDLTDASAQASDASRDTIVRMSERFGTEVSRRVTDVFGRIIDRMKGNCEE